MQLEDHAGDILRKARLGAGDSTAAAAALAGVPAEAWERLEQSGNVRSTPGLRAVAAKWGVQADRLLAVADGWMPAAREFDTWRELRRVTTTRGSESVHAYIIWDEATRDAAVFDSGWEAGPILDLVRREQLQLKHLFLTHLHDDHTGGMAAMREAFPKLRLHTNSRTAPPEHRNRANDCVHVGSLRVMNRATPGHAEEGVVYIVGNWPEDAPPVAMVGDTIFAGSLATGFQSLDLLRQSVREQILVLPGETLLCPGHGPVTTVAEEQAHNPFF